MLTTDWHEEHGPERLGVGGCARILIHRVLPKVGILLQRLERVPSEAITACSHWARRHRRPPFLCGRRVGVWCVGVGAAQEKHAAPSRKQAGPLRTGASRRRMNGLPSHDSFSTQTPAPWPLLPALGDPCPAGIAGRCIGRHWSAAHFFFFFLCIPRWLGGMQQC
jgi:hypothetical protein